MSNGVAHSRQRRRFGLIAGARVMRAVWLAVALPCSISILLVLVPAAEASQSRRFVDTINQVRKVHCLPALRVSESLQESSGDYAWWMLDAGYFGHRASIRMSNRFVVRGEVLASTDEETPSTESVVSEWLQSPSHRAVLLNPRFRFIGVGTARGWLRDLPRTLVTAHLGATERTRGVEQRGARGRGSCRSRR